MPLFLWLPYIVFNGLFVAPKPNPALVPIPTRD
jgi:hypothetical protein